MLGIIYGYRNIHNNKWYVGLTINEKRRFAKHKNFALNKGSMLAFHCAIRKYGYESFEYSVLQEVFAESKEDLIKLLNIEEVKWVNIKNSFINGYNSTSGGDCPIKSEETKKKISLAKMGKKLSEIHRLSIVASLIGRKHSDETKKKMSDKALGRVKTKEHCDNISKGKKGKILTLEERQKISDKSTNKRPVNKLNSEGFIIDTFESAAAAAKSVGADASQILKTCKNPRLTCKGFRWSFIND